MTDGWGVTIDTSKLRLKDRAKRMPEVQDKIANQLARVAVSAETEETPVDTGLQRTTMAMEKVGQGMYRAGPHTHYAKYTVRIGPKKDWLDNAKRAVEAKKITITELVLKQEGISG